MPSIDSAGQIQLAANAPVTVLAGSIVKIYAADDTYLVGKTIGSATAQGDGTVTASLGNADVQAGVTNKDASYAIIFDADGTTPLIGNGTHLTVGTSGTDIIVDDVTGWNAGDHINGGTLTFTAPTATA